MTLFAGLDIGTGGGRCLVVDEQGRQVGYGERAWRYRSDGPGDAQLDPGAVMEALAAAVRDATATCDPTRVGSIGVTSQRTGVVFVAADGTEIDAGANTDARAIAEGIAQEREHGAEIYRVTGRGPALLYMPARYAWLRANRPADAARVAHALSFSDWFCRRLTGEAATERTQAAELLALDVATGERADALLSALEVPGEIVPPMRAPGVPTGELRPDVAGALGLRAGTPVVAAGGDTQAAVLAMGGDAPGVATVVAGTTMIVARGLAAPAPDPAGRLWTSPALTGGWVRESHCGEAGAALAWFADVVGSAVGELVERADGSAPGAGGAFFVDAHPSVATDFALVRQATFTFPAPVLALGRPAHDLARAMLEGIAFAACEGLTWIEDLDGPSERLVVCGGVARSDAFVSAVAGAGERPVTVPAQPASSALGACIVAAAAHHGGVGRACATMHDRGRSVPPDPAHGYPALRAAWRERAAAVEAGAMRMKGLLG